MTMPAVSFTRPSDTTAYASGDLVANSTTAGSVVPLTLLAASDVGGPRLLRRVRVRKSGTGVTNASFRLHLYSAVPVAANGDNSAWSTSAVASYLGAMDVTVDRAFTDGAAGIAVPLHGSEIAVNAQVAVYALIEARAAYTPASGEIFTLQAEAPLVA
jgi:hypothetical protein